MTAVALRPGRDDDAAGFIALIGAAWAEYRCVLDVDGEVPELRALATSYAGHGGALWAAEHSGRVVGMVATKPLADGDWELCKMYAAPAQRGTGLAQRLIDAAETFARDHGATRMRLWSDSRFDRAHRFYEKQSYVRTGPLRVLNDISATVEFAYAKPLAGVRIEKLDAASAVSAEFRLAEILRACVNDGASVSFLPPMSHEAAAAFWKRKASEVAQGKRVLLAGWVDGVLAGTVSLNLDMTENQPHRADLQKLLVHPAARRRSLARLLMHAAEDAARASSRRLLVLDTLADTPAEGLYRELGWNETGRIPGYSLNAAGEAEDTVVFWKNVGSTQV